MSQLNDKVGGNNESVKYDHLVEENLKDDTVKSHSTGQLTEKEVGDAALANAPWKYKLIALVTALLFPRKVYKIILLCKLKRI